MSLSIFLCSILFKINIIAVNITKQHPDASRSHQKHKNYHSMHGADDTTQVPRIKMISKELSILKVS